MADNALGEAAGSEPRVASDAACSRVLETLLPHASITALTAFVGALCEGENLGATCTRYAGLVMGSDDERRTASC